MKLFPLFVRLEGRTCLVVGGGAAAAAKARLLRQAGAEVSFAADRLEAEAQGMVADGSCAGLAAPGSGFDYSRFALVYAATGDRDTDREVAGRARAAGVLTGIVDDPEASDFQTPAIVDRGDVVVAISTGGAAPVLARRLRAAIERAVPEGVSRLGRLMADFKDTVRSKWSDTAARRRVWEDFLDSPAAEAALRGDEAAAQRAAIAHINRAAAGGGPEGRVTLVGAGPGAADLMTLRAIRALQSADVIVHDRLIGPDVLDHARRDAERIPVGKAKGRKSASQAEINALLLEQARAGRRVVRLKGGDPFVFGRGGEELEYLREHGVAVDAIPGVTAAAGCAASALLPLTHRDLSDGVAYVTAHEGQGKPEADWAALAAGGRTIVVYMGVSKAREIVDRLTAHGLSRATPVTVIENGTLPGERIIGGSLGALPDIVEGAGIVSPALIVIGEVARLATTNTAYGIDSRAAMAV